MFIGVVTTDYTTIWKVYFGEILKFIAWILVAVGFFNIKATTPMPTPPPPAPPPPTS